MVLLALLIGSARRGTLAMHAKLDAITPGDALNRLEERCEPEIEALRS